MINQTVWNCKHQFLQSSGFLPLAEDREITDVRGWRKWKRNLAEMPIFFRILNISLAGLML